jgi:hypothetical protein
MKLKEVMDYLKSRVMWHKRSRLLHRLQKNDLVLDVGSGNNPVPRANILCDLYLTKDVDRGYRHLVRDTRPFIVCDARHLPFRSKIFTFVNCSSVLEHLNRPELCTKELQRVAETGYIDTVTTVREMISRQPYHKCIVKYEHNKFLFLHNIFPYRKLIHFLWGKFPIFTFFWAVFDELSSFLTLRIFFDKNRFYKI